MRTIKVIFALILAVSMLSAVCFAEGTADAATAALEAMVGVTAAEADVYTLLKFRTIVCDKAGFEALVKRMGAVKKEAK